VGRLSAMKAGEQVLSVRAVGERVVVMWLGWSCGGRAG
jgi:hypothetical protein